MDFFQSHQTVPKPLLSYLLPPERSIALVKRLAGSPKGAEIDLPPANKVLLQVAHAFLYTLMDFFQSHQTVPSRLSYLLPFSRTFNCTSKRLAGSPKGAEIDPNLPHANKVLLKVAHAFLYTLMDFFQSHQTVPSRCYLTFLPFPERSIALVKRLAGSPKELKLIPTPR
jgi:hypothetical protein